MLPSYGFDWPPVPDDIEVPLRKGNLKVDYAWGAATIGATPPPLNRNVLWTFRLLGSTIQGIRNGLPPIEILTDSGIVEFGVAFDRDMFPVVVYKLRSGIHLLRYYDHVQNGYVVKQLPALARSPRVVYDLKAQAADGVAEVVVAWFQGKDIYVAQSSKGYENPRLAASYLQDLYLDQISFAANNRLRFIVYQLSRPEDVPEVNPIPQSKFSTFLYRRNYTGSTPIIPDDVATFSSAGLKYILSIKEDDITAPSVRIYPMSICLRPEYVDWLRDRGEQDRPILRITKTFSSGMDTDEELTLNQLTARGGLVYDNDLKLYRSNFDHITEGPNKRSIIINLTDLIVGERSVLIVDELH